MRVLIYGGRDWNDQARMDAALNAIHAECGFTQVINGGQLSRTDAGIHGADWQAADWSKRHDIPIRYFYADWRAHGGAAGPIRNQRMLAEGQPDVGVQFTGGAGTADMRRRLDRAGVRVLEVHW